MIALITLCAVVAGTFATDSCDTYVHPQYGKGSCIPTDQCANANYISGLCESNPADVKCCFSSGGSESTCTGKMTHAAALAQVNAVGISVVSSGGCSDRTRSTCTSLTQINCASICLIKTFKSKSGCKFSITGGTEVGHASGTYSHYNGYKLDITYNTCTTSFITGHYHYSYSRSNGDRVYKDSKGNEYANERNHWDITAMSC